MAKLEIPIIPILIILILGVAVYFSAGGALPFAVAVPQDGYILKPEFGYTQCEPIVFKKVTAKEATGDNALIANTEAFNIYAERATPYVQCVGDKIKDVLLQYDANSTKAGSCKIGCVGSDEVCWCRSTLASGTSEFPYITNIENPIETTLQYGEQLRVRCVADSGFLGLGAGRVDKVVISLEGDQFGLKTHNIRSPTPLETILPEGCDLSKVSPTAKANLLSSNVTGKLTFRANVPYVIDWSPTVTFQSLIYNGQTATCSGSGIIYNVKDVTFGNGVTYKIAGDVIGNEVCCPGMRITNNLICNNNFQYVEIGGPDDDVQCASQADVPGGGAGYVFTGSEIICGSINVEKYTCTNNKPTVADTKSVECLQPDSCCPDSYVCSVDNKCVFAGLAECGDGICAPSETVTSCPSDCVTGQLGGIVGAGLFEGIGKWFSDLLGLDDLGATVNMIIGVIIVLIVVALIIWLVMTILGKGGFGKSLGGNQPVIIITGG